MAVGKLISKLTIMPLRNPGTGNETKGMRNPMAKRWRKALEIASDLFSNSSGSMRSESTRPNEMP